MQNEQDDVNREDLSEEQINDMEERRVDSLNEAGIDEKEVLSKALDYVNSWNSYFNENIVRGKDDMNFVIRDQWTAVERSEFTRLFKPCMTFNKLYDPVKKLVGEQRKNKPDLIVRSLTGKASQEQITLRADLVRTISYQSQNDLVYQTAFKSALLMGFGCFQVLMDYESAKSFNRVIRYDIIPDPTSCGWDPTALKPHKGDGNYCYRDFTLTRNEFYATYPYVTNAISCTNQYNLLDFQWQTKDIIVVRDLFVKEWHPVIVMKLSNGDVVTEDEWEERQKMYKKQQEIARDAEGEHTISSKIIEKEIPIVVAQRQTQDYKIMHYRVTRDMIIDFSEWPSRHLPILFVDGDSYYIDGKQYTKSFIHEARDAQKCVNYFNSEIAAEIKNRRREQWLGTPDNIIGYEQDWRNPELQIGILRAKPDPKTGQMPSKQAPWDLSAQLITNAQRATQDIKEIIGVSESEQVEGRDISGKARLERKLESGMSAYVFMDNLNQAIEQSGRIVNDLLPYVIGQDPRTMTLSKQDGRTEPVTMNQQMPDGKTNNQLDKEDYDIEIDAGPSFAAQKDVSLQFFQETVAANPQVFNLIADLWAENLDITNMQQVKDRLENLVPPEILAKERGQQPPPKQPNPQEMMAQQQMQMQQQEMQMKAQQLKMNEQKMQLEAQQLSDRADALRLQQQKHQLEQAELVLHAHKLQHDRSSGQQKNEVAMNKAEMDYNAKIASLMTDLHKHHTQGHEGRSKEKESKSEA